MDFYCTSCGSFEAEAVLMFFAEITSLLMADWFAMPVLGWEEKDMM